VEREDQGSTRFLSGIISIHFIVPDPD